MKQISLALISVVLFLGGCGHMGVNPKWDTSKLEANKGIVFGRVSTIEFNGEKVDYAACSITYGDEGMDAASGGIFEKTVSLKAGEYFSFSTTKGMHRTTRFNCTFDVRLHSQVEIEYFVQPQALNYMGNIAIHVTMKNSWFNRLKKYFPPFPNRLDGGMTVYVVDSYSPEASNYYADHPELKNLRAHNTTAIIR